ncbi:MAG: flagellar biosynthesis protein FlgD [Bdellovibrionaceae bacterium]|jgi:flagellar basal-body rod modification protein FlgD|nr:flagellar biosynthesis protein FlgD [Pseudobdellovibrionaceae bacterium]
MAIMGLTRTTKIERGDVAPSPSGNKEQQLSSEELKKLGVNDVGELANKISNPNYMPQDSARKGVGNDKLDKDAFMKIMLVQMKHQDPTNPLKSHEMAAQLAQFSSLEQMQNMNQSLDELKAQNKPLESFQTLNLIGKKIAGDSAQIYRVKGDRDHDISYRIPSEAQKLTIQIKDERGDTVRQVTLSGVKAGQQVWSWNGQDQNGKVLPAGNYRVSIEAISNFGKKMPVTTSFEGTVTGVNFTPQGAILLVGNQTVRLSDVRKIEDPSLNPKAQKKSEVSVPDLSAAASIGNTEQEQGAPEREEKPGLDRIFDQVALSRDMMERLGKEVKTPERTAGGEP